MASNIIPFILFNLFLFWIYTKGNSINENTTTQIISLLIISKSIPVIGFIADVIPITTNKLNIFDPIKFPIAKSLCFFNDAATDAASSGILVPIATIVILIILSDTLNLLATDIDDYGFKGNVVDALKRVTADIKTNFKIFTCGPPGMMKAVFSYCEKNNIDCDLALETIMACGIGICQGCTIVKNTESTNTYRNHYALACKDGPIFNIKEINNAFL